jgi:hypothetical protein
MLAGKSPTPPQNLVTQPYQTVAILLTQATPETPPATSISKPTDKPTSTPRKPTPGNQPGTSTPVSTTELHCNRASPGNPIDVTIPDDSAMLPRQAFTKTWRLQNTGVCAWSKEYAIVWFSGESFDASREIFFSNPIQPGQTVDITVDMRAPEKPGTYQSNWKLKNADGELFGIGPSGNAPFWARIIVIQVDTPAPPPTASPTATPAIQTSGISNLRPGDSLNLDTLQLSNNSESDLDYRQDEAGLHHIFPGNGARIGDFIDFQPNFQECKNDALEANQLDLDAAPIGSYFCYRSNQGLPGWGRLVYFNNQDGVLVLELLTWSSP